MINHNSFIFIIVENPVTKATNTCMLKILRSRLFWSIFIFSLYQRKYRWPLATHSQSAICLLTVRVWGLLTNQNSIYWRRQSRCACKYVVHYLISMKPSYNPVTACLLYSVDDSHCDIVYTYTVVYMYLIRCFSEEM